MSQEWGRANTAGTWPRPKPVWTLALLLAAMVSGAAVGMYRYAVIWTPLQRLFLSPYLRSEFASALAFKTGRYRLLLVIDRKGSRLPLDEEVQPLTTDETTFAISDLGVQAGNLRLAWQERSYDHATLHAALREWIYRDQTLTDLAMPALWGSAVVFLVGLVIAIPKDLARARARRHGRRLKGPELVTAVLFNRRTHANGIGFVQVPSFAGRVSGRRRWVQVPRAIESSHLLIMGDSGTGKSALIRQILCQLEERGDTAIVYDPALEYTPQFYTPERGDVILNPLDTRGPYWSPGDELGAAERRARLAEHGGGHPQAVAGRTRHHPAMERGGMGARAPRLALPHEHTGDPRTPRPAHEPVAGHAGAAANESGAAESASRVVHPG